LNNIRTPPLQWSPYCDAALWAKNFVHAITRDL
jgi:hypothetical protein